ncbi:RHO1 GDP-GTP exchange protein 2 [Dispira simplex]|nr:RHO1 GDP-GTP exchange protein 2 [Dispira simplex]
MPHEQSIPPTSTRQGAPPVQYSHLSPSSTFYGAPLPSAPGGYTSGPSGAPHPQYQSPGGSTGALFDPQGQSQGVRSSGPVDYGGYTQRFNQPYSIPGRGGSSQSTPSVVPPQNQYPPRSVDVQQQQGYPAGMDPMSVASRQSPASRPSGHPQPLYGSNTSAPGSRPAPTYPPGQPYHGHYNTSSMSLRSNYTPHHYAHPRQRPPMSMHTSQSAYTHASRYAYPQPVRPGYPAGTNHAVRPSGQPPPPGSHPPANQPAGHMGLLTQDNHQQYLTQQLDQITLEIEGDAPVHDGQAGSTRPKAQGPTMSTIGSGDSAVANWTTSSQQDGAGNLPDGGMLEEANDSAGALPQVPMTRRKTDSAVPVGTSSVQRAAVGSQSVRVGANNAKPLPQIVTYSGTVGGEMTLSQPSATVGTSNRRSMSMSSARSVPYTLPAPRAIPPVYPALLSRVSDAFRLLVPLRTHIRGTTEYPVCFTGIEAVDVISAIIHATDRNLALLYGRAMDAHGFFHHVEYTARLRDSSDELYMFHELIPLSRQIASPGDDDDTHSDITLFAPTEVPSRTESTSYLPTGVFTPLADCYSPTCSVDRICYSITCPRSLEQRARARMSANPEVSQTLALAVAESDAKNRFWAMSVPKHVVDSVSKKEHKRQEAIFELIITESDYVRDIEVMNECYIKPIRHRDLIAEDKRDKFIFAIFYNVMDLYKLNKQLRDDLLRRQSVNYVVSQVGDVLKYHVNQFIPYLKYGAYQTLAQHFLEVEIHRNKRLEQFLEKQRSLPETRRLPIKSFLTRPTARLARYPLLIKAILKSTPENHPDQKTLKEAEAYIEKLLKEIDVKTGEAQNKVDLGKLSEQLQCKPSDLNDLNLLQDGRRLLRHGALKRRSNVDTGELTCYLLDHMFLMAKRKKTREGEPPEFKIFKRPIPLELLTVTIPDDPMDSHAAGLVNAPNPPSVTGAISRNSGGGGSGSGLSKPLGIANSMFSSTTHLPNHPLQRAGGVGAADNNNAASARVGFPIILTHLGRRGSSQTLYANTAMERQDWLDNILKQRDIKARQNMKFELVPLATRTFPLYEKVNTSVTFDHNRRVAIGTDHGIYIGLNNDPDSFEKLPLPQDKVHQIDILEEYNIFFILADKDRNLWAYPLEALNPTLAVNAKGRKVHSHVTFFKAGLCLNRVLVCSVRSGPISTSIKSDEPVAPNQIPRNKSLGRLFPRGGHEILRPFRELYIPSETYSLHLFKALIIVGCQKGFEIVDPVSGDTQELLDPKDDSLNFVRKRENIRPTAIFKLQCGDFLLCYDEIAFYVNKNGQRARPHWVIHWEGEPTSFSLWYPYILAFSPNFIEVRHVETGQCEQIIITGNSSSLCTDPNSMHCVATPSLTEPQRVYKLLPIGRTNNIHRKTY